jgi:hypothetical protein
VPGTFELLPDLLACHLESVPVGDDDRRAVAETLPEDTGDGGELARPDIHALCVRSLLQGGFDEPVVHMIYSPAAGVRPATWRSVLCISSFICGYASK